MFENKHHCHYSRNIIIPLYQKYHWGPSTIVFDSGGLGVKKVESQPSVMIVLMSL